MKWNYKQIGVKTPFAIKQSGIKAFDLSIYFWKKCMIFIFGA